MNEYENSEMLFNMYADMIIRISFQIVKNQADAEDVCQEVFIKLFSYKKTFESEEHRKAWIIRVTINKSKDIVKSNWFSKRAELPNDIPVYENETLPIIGEIMRLSVKYRTVIYLYYFEGYTVKEIAKILECSENTVLTRLRRARKKLEYFVIGGSEYE